MMRPSFRIFYCHFYHYNLLGKMGLPGYSVLSTDGIICLVSSTASFFSPLERYHFILLYHFRSPVVVFFLLLFWLLFPLYRGNDARSFIVFCFFFSFSFFLSIHAPGETSFHQSLNINFVPVVFGILFHRS